MKLPLHIEDGLTEWLDPSLVGEKNYAPPSSSILRKTFTTIDNTYKSKLHPSFPESEPELLIRMEKVYTYILSQFFFVLFTIGV